MIIFSSTGIIISVNTLFNTITEQQTEVSNNVHSKSSEKKSFLWLTNNSDAFVFTINPETLLATLYVQATAVEQLTLDQLLDSCKQLINQK